MGPAGLDKDNAQSNNFLGFDIGSALDYLFGNQKAGTTGMAGPLLGGVAAGADAYSNFLNAQAARDSADTQRAALSANLANQTQAYNTQLEDTMYARNRDRGSSPSQARATTDAFLAANRLPEPKI